MVPHHGLKADSFLVNYGILSSLLYYNVVTAPHSSGQWKLHLPQDRLWAPLVAFCPLGMPRPSVYGIPLGQNATRGAHNLSFCRCNFHYPSERGAVIPHSGNWGSRWIIVVVSSPLPLLCFNSFIFCGLVPPSTSSSSLSYHKTCQWQNRFKSVQKGAYDSLHGFDGNVMTSSLRDICWYQKTLPNLATDQRLRSVENCAEIFNYLISTKS